MTSAHLFCQVGLVIVGNQDSAVVRTVLARTCFVAKVSSNRLWQVCVSVQPFVDVAILITSSARQAMICVRVHRTNLSDPWIGVDPTLLDSNSSPTKQV
jgi:hypothetical protein